MRALPAQGSHKSPAVIPFNNRKILTREVFGYTAIEPVIVCLLEVEFQRKKIILYINTVFLTLSRSVNVALIGISFALV